MSYNNTTHLPDAPGIPQQPFMRNFAPMMRDDRPSTTSQSAEVYFHGEALARDEWAERYGAWIVLGFAALFALFLVGMELAGQIPGKSFLLKSISDILQFVGEGIGFLFCMRIAIRLRGVAIYLRQEVRQKERERCAPNELAIARTEALQAQRAFLAWTFLAVAIALYASGQAVWTSYDIRMNSADVPFPGIYDLGFVASYPFFLAGTLLLTRRNKAMVGRTRLVLDALAVIGVALALSWFFLLGPSIAGLTQAPNAGAAFLSIYFPTGDLFLVAVGAFLMFSPLANRAQQPVFLCLCLGLFFLAITDSLLSYYSLSSSFNTGTLQDVLWPLSMSLVGLAAIEYPRSVAREQEQAERAPSAAVGSVVWLVQGRFSQLTASVQTIMPFILVLMTCALLLTVVSPRGGAVLVQADVVALMLVIIVVVRQALTLLENNRLTMQMRGELVISRRELQVTRREADEATRTAQEKQVLEEGVAALRAIHARVARGDLAARAPTIPGPLLPIAVSLNLMLDRLSAMSQRGVRYDQLVQECKQVQDAVDRLGQGLPAWSSPLQMSEHSSELRTVFLGLAHLQRIQESQWRRLASALDALCNLTRHLREALKEVLSSQLFATSRKAHFERMIMERISREVDLLEQQQKSLLHQFAQASARYEGASSAGKTKRSRREEAEYRQGDERFRPAQAGGKDEFGMLPANDADASSLRSAQRQGVRYAQAGGKDEFSIPLANELRSEQSHLSNDAFASSSRSAQVQGMRYAQAGGKEDELEEGIDAEDLIESQDFLIPSSFETNSYSLLSSNGYKPHHIIRRSGEE